MPDFQAVCLDTTETYGGVTYAECLAALTTITNGHLDYTATLTELECPHDGNLVVVFFIADEDELTGDAAAVHEDNFKDDANLLAQTRWPTLALFEARGGHNVLGLSQRATDVPGVADRDFWWVGTKTRQSTGTAAGPGYSTGDGKTYKRRLDGLDDTTDGTEWQAGAGYMICGPHIRERIWVTTAGHTAENMKPFAQGDNDADPVCWYFDYRYNPGVFAGGLQDNNYDGYDAGRNWDQDGSDPDVWSRIGGAYDNDQWGYYYGPTKSRTALFSENFLLHVTSEAEVRATPWSWWKDEENNTTWINIPGGEDPRFRIGWTSLGTSPGFDFAEALIPSDTSSRSTGFRFVNAQMINIGSLGTSYFPKSEWLGGRYLANSSFKPQTIATGTVWGWSEDGEIVYDVSDRPDPDTDAYLIELIERKGSDYTTWKTMMPGFLEFYAAAEGIYEYGAGFTDKDGFDAYGILADEIGAFEDTARQMAWSHYDGHVFGAQGVSNLTARFFYIRRADKDQAGNAAEMYAINDDSNCQNVQNLLFQDGVFVNCGIGFSGAGAYKRSNGTGLLDGNVVDRCIVGDRVLPTDPATYNGVATGGTGVFSTYADEKVTVKNSVFLRCANPIAGEANVDMCQDGGEGQNPLRGMLGGASFRTENNDYVDVGTRIHNHRQTNMHQALKTIVSITKGAQTLVEITGHGFPDVAQSDVYIEPEIYFDEMEGMTELDGSVYKCVWVSADTFYIKDLDGNDVDSSAFGDFVSGGSARAHAAGFQMLDNTLEGDGIDGDSTLWKYANGNYSRDEVQAFAATLQQHLPGCADAIYESGTVINP